MHTHVCVPMSVHVRIHRHTCAHTHSHARTHMHTHAVLLRAHTASRGLSSSRLAPRSRPHTEPLCSPPPLCSSPVPQTHGRSVTSSAALCPPGARGPRPVPAAQLCGMASCEPGRSASQAWLRGRSRPPCRSAPSLLGPLDQEQICENSCSWGSRFEGSESARSSDSFRRGRQELTGICVCSGAVESSLGLRSSLRRKGVALTTQGGAARARRPEPGGPGRPEPRPQRLRTRWARAGARRAGRGLGGARLLPGTSEPPGSVHRPSRLPADEPPPGRAVQRDGAQWDITSRTPCCHPEAQAPCHLGERGAGEAPGPPGPARRRAASACTGPDAASSRWTVSARSFGVPSSRLLGMGVLVLKVTLSRPLAAPCSISSRHAERPQP